jgi:hypothetical protein
MKWEKQLLPPTDFKDVKDEPWEKCFGRVNSRTKTAKEIKETPVKTYQKYLAEKMGWDTKHL